MANTKGISTASMESESGNFHPLISWRSVVAGLLIAFFSMMGLLGLGMAFGGIGLEDGASARGAGIFTGVWFLISALLSIFAGSYFAARVSKFQTSRVGSAQGLVIAALFLGIFLFQTIAAIGTVGQATGSLIGQGAGALRTGVQQAAGNETVQNMVEDAMGDLNLRAEPQQVATGLANRLIRGDTEGAKNYLARQTGISPAEADQRINQMQQQINEFLATVRDGTATALKSVGWSLFLLVLLGALASIAGGALGSSANFRKPLVRREFTVQHA
jgi:hypothetical protein